MPTDTSPFPFIAWKDDENSIVVSTPNTSLGYIALLQVDGVDAEDIVRLAKKKKGDEKWELDFAESFPGYVEELAKQSGKECFVQKGTSHVMYAELDSGEVQEADFASSKENYNEAVRVEGVRAAHGHKKAHPQSDRSAENDDDEYESVDEEDDDNPKASAYMQKRHYLEVLSTQLEAAISMAIDIGLTADEVRAAYEKASSGHPVPSTPDECLAIAQTDAALMQFVSNLYGENTTGECAQQ